MVNYLPMAIIRTSPILSAVSGAIGGVVFAKGKRGTVARQRPRHTPRRSAVLLEQQALYANIVRAWQSLSPEQREAWRALALDFPTTNRLGVTSAPSGFQTFVSVNLFSRGMSSFVPSNPPRRGSLLTLVDVSVLFREAGSYRVTVTVTGSDEPTAVQISGSRAFSKAVPKFPKRFRIVHQQALLLDPVETFEIFAGWVDVFGAMEADEAFAVTVQLLDPADMIFPLPLLTRAANVLPT